MLLCLMQLTVNHHVSLKVRFPGTMLCFPFHIPTILYLLF